MVGDLEKNVWPERTDKRWDGWTRGNMKRKSMNKRINFCTVCFEIIGNLFPKCHIKRLFLCVNLNQVHPSPLQSLHLIWFHSPPCLQAGQSSVAPATDKQSAICVFLCTEADKAEHLLLWGGKKSTTEKKGATVGGAREKQGRRSFTLRPATMGEAC